MARVKRGVAAHKRHKRLLRQAEGRRGTRSKLVRPAREALFHALVYAYRDRRTRKRVMRRLWIERINAASRAHGIPYSRLTAGLKASGVGVVQGIIPARAMTPGPRHPSPPPSRTPSTNCCTARVRARDR